MKQGEIWLVRYPDDGAGHEFFKERPALVIESDRQIQCSNGYTVMAVTSNVTNLLKEDIIVVVDQKNRLHKDSVIKVHHIQTFDQSRFLKRIGEADASVMEQVKSYIRKHFDV